MDKRIERKSIPAPTVDVIRALFGCKWSLTVFELIERGVQRPGEMVRSVEGLTTKSLNECAGRLLEFGILEKRMHAEVPPRVEYRITERGQKVRAIFDQIGELAAEVDASPDPSR